MTTFIPADGAQVESLLGPDASILITCPGCGHLTPNVPAACLTVDPATAVAPWLDCGCQHGIGRSRYNVPISGCDCMLRFRLAPTGAGNRYWVAGVDHQTMAERRATREMDVALGGTIDDAGDFLLTEISLVAAGTGTPQITMRPRSPRARKPKVTPGR